MAITKGLTSKLIRSLNSIAIRTQQTTYQVGTYLQYAIARRYLNTVLTYDHKSFRNKKIQQLFEEYKKADPIGRANVTAYEYIKRSRSKKLKELLEESLREHKQTIRKLKIEIGQDISNLLKANLSQINDLKNLQKELEILIHLETYLGRNFMDIFKIVDKGSSAIQYKLPDLLDTQLKKLGDDFVEISIDEGGRPIIDLYSDIASLKALKTLLKGQDFQIDHIVEKKIYNLIDRMSGIPDDEMFCILIPDTIEVARKLAGYKGYNHRVKSTLFSMLVPNSQFVGYTMQQIWAAHILIYKQLSKEWSETLIEEVNRSFKETIMPIVKEAVESGKYHVPNETGIIDYSLVDSINLSWFFDPNNWPNPISLRNNMDEIMSKLNRLVEK